MGHQVKLLPGKAVKGFVTGNKNDRHDARAIWTAVQQPHVKAVAIKTEEQQAMLALHRMRSQLVKFRTAQINGLQGLLTEYGEVDAARQAGVRRGITDALARMADRLPAMVIDTLREQWARISKMDEKLPPSNSASSCGSKQQACKRIAEIPGVGPLTANRSGRHHHGRCQDIQVGTGVRCLCWPGTATNRNRRADQMLGISKRGGTHLRTLLIHGARAVLTNSKGTDLGQRITPAPATQCSDRGSG